MAGKYPTTCHLPFSPADLSDDDVYMKNDNVLSMFVNREVVITEKLDGGNCCIDEGGRKVFARTHSQVATHASFGPVKQLANELLAMNAIAVGMELYGENMTGIHSIEYDRLKSYFYLFGVRKTESDDRGGSEGESNRCKWLSWSECEELSVLLQIPTVPILFKGSFQSTNDIKLWMESNAKGKSSLSTTESPEGFVIRIAESFDDSQFQKSIAKFVRANHIQTDSNWLRTWKKATLYIDDDDDQH